MVARDAQARILAVAPLPLPYFSVVLEVPADYAAVAAGQFVMIETRPGLEPYLRRAFSVHDVSSGPAGVRIELLGKVVGRGTRALAEARAGETRALLGPLGRPFSAPPAGARVALVAGGVGSAPLYLLARELAARGARFDLYYGGRTALDLPRRDDFRALVEDAGGALVEVTEDGSRGVRGRVTEPLADALAAGRYAFTYSCGPMPMLARLAAVSTAAGVAGEAALETEMGCGFGACLGCAVPHVSGRYALCCKDGPVFRLDEVRW
jgi:dihydroorotate dehydrogenase electron transfer subunit